MTTGYRNLPAVDALVQQLVQAAPELPRAVLTLAAREAVAEARATISAGQAAPTVDALGAAALGRARTLTTPTLRPVINASGVILQTNLGRAPLSAAALAAMQTVAAGYSDLEYDLKAGARGSRYNHLTGLLQRLTGAEAALVVNNCAAAVYLALSALAAGRQVIVSRGQAVEIGGGFRIPDVLRQSGAALVEVGTTNRTYARDYAAAITAETGALLRVHTSNFRLMGFVHETPLAELAAVGRAHGVPVLDDLGSGTLLPTAPYGLTAEPTVQQSIADGADLVMFSGDKLLGGPQAGLIVGRAALIARLREHPLARALRVDKLTIAALEATLLAYLRGTALTELPVWRMISTPAAALRPRAAALAAGTGGSVVAAESAVGGGALPGDTLPSLAVALDTDHPDELAARLRRGADPVVARVNGGRLLLDVRTVLPDQDAALLAAVQAAIAGT